MSLGAEKLMTAISDRIAERGLTDVAVKRVGCVGLCAIGPNVEVPERRQLFEAVDPSSPEAIDRVVDALAGGGDGRPTDTDSFYVNQVRVVLANSGLVDPEDTDDFIAHGGYEALKRVLTTMKPEEVIDEIVTSGLRGRGGAGYPTGLKWRTVAKSLSTDGKYVICNADEGDPGAFMDRRVLESSPQQVLEGMAIAGYAVGATQGYIYVRAEYTLAVKRLRLAIRQAEHAGLLGNSIADTAFRFHIDIRIGAGAFVCGEETALIASVEGGRGTPRPRPPFPAQAGLWGKPTLINNVETLASISAIINHGGEWYKAMGTEKSPGTKVFALAGRVVNTGLIEMPMGVTLREIVYGIGGGIIGGAKFKAVQTGGPSGGCIPAADLDMPVDYESLAKAGSIMGSGGMIIMDETSCMVDVAKYFMDFCREESCGKCVPCRVGTTQLHMLLDKISRGEGELADLDTLEHLADVVKSTALCGLGQSAPNPVFSTLRYFRDEYLAHIQDGVCPAGVCTMNSRVAS
jgi:NADH:ubiquinone oxidoreductase subunit F (NADH-binding)/(2Fe-2S) ferredoxin